MDFCFFLTHFNFQSLSDFYINQWNNTFNQSKEVIDKILKLNSHDEINKYSIDKNNSLILEYYDYLNNNILNKEVKNINNYCLGNIINYLSPIYNTNIFDNIDKKIEKTEFTSEKITIDEYLIESYLKYDSNDEYYFNKIWDIWENHLIKIFTSKTTRNAFEMICKLCCKNFNYYDFLNPNDLKYIFKKSRYFRFPANMLGLTEPHFLIDYEYYRGFIPALGLYCSKLLNLATNQITKEHEILGNINIELQKYISKKEVISSVVNSENSLNKENEYGDYIENLLYGHTLTQFTYNEILFLLDESNYNDTVEKFKENFNKCNNTLYEASDKLKSFLKSLDIGINNNDMKFGYMSVNDYLINKFSSQKYKLSFRSGHTHLHKPRGNEYESIINEIYESVFGFKRY